MQNFKLIKSISLIICAFLITSCSNNSAMKPEDFKNKEPRLIIEEYLSGNVKAWGVLQNRSGKVTRQFNADLNGTWDGKQLILKEKFNIYLGLSVIVGLIGVALVIQPGFGAFNKFFLLVLLGAFLISGANLIVNKFNKEVSPLGYFIYGGFFVHLTCAVLFIADPIFLRFSEMILIFIASLFVNSAVLLIGIAFQLAQRHYASISCLIYIQFLCHKRHR